MSLLTEGNPKILKGTKKGYLSAVMHLAPAKLSGHNVCPHATPGCIAACLNTAGRGGIGLDENGLNVIQRARIARTLRFYADRETFMTDLAGEIAKHIRKAERKGLIPAIRLNGTSDLPWERFAVTYNGVRYANIMHAFPTITFYDYTKWPVRLRHPELAPGNYSLTFSAAETAKNEIGVLEAIAAGVNVAAVFSTRKGQALPATWHGAPVIDGDEHDLRFIDPSGVVVGLRAKGRGKKDESGFVKDAETPMDRLLTA